MKQISLPAHHYAAAWKTEGVIKTIPEITDIGRRYAELPAGSPEKEDLLLEICHCFHPYLMKYLVMICRGQVPIRCGNTADKLAPINKDIKPFLLFSPQRPIAELAHHERDREAVSPGVQRYGTEEVYDVLMEQLVATVKGYDPKHTEKVRMAVEVIENELRKRKQFSFADVNRHLEFDCNRYIRLLGRLGFLKSEP